MKLNCFVLNTFYSNDHGETNFCYIPIVLRGLVQIPYLQVPPTLTGTVGQGSTNGCVPPQRC